MAVIKVSIKDLNNSNNNLNCLKSNINAIQWDVENIRNRVDIRIQQRYEIGNRLISVREKLKNVERDLKKVQDVVGFSLCKYTETEKEILNQSEEIF